MLGRGRADILWFNADLKALVRWDMSGAVREASAWIAAPTWRGPAWEPFARADLNGDGQSDLAWRTGLGDYRFWVMSAGQMAQSEGGLSLTPPYLYAPVGAGDLDGDGKDDLVLEFRMHIRPENISLWTVLDMDGTTVAARLGYIRHPDWQPAAFADLDADGRADIVWRNGRSGDVWVTLQDGGTIKAQGGLAAPGWEWRVAAAADFNGDGRGDVIFTHASGGVWGALTAPGGLGFEAQGWIGTAGAGWRLARAADYDGNGKSDLLFVNDTHGHAWMWRLDGLSVVASEAVGSAGAGWILV